jgi:hypothetical protein
MCSWDFDIYRIYWTRVRELGREMAKLQHGWTVPMKRAVTRHVRYVPTDANGAVSVVGAYAAACAAVVAEVAEAAAAERKRQLEVEDEGEEEEQEEVEEDSD